MSTPASPSHGFDPEAEQEVDFAKYVRLLAARWWLLAAGLVVGAVIGYLISLGGTQVYSASATIYLGQPYSPTGGTPVQTPQTNPGAVGQIVHSQFVLKTVANACGAKKVSAFKNGISSQAAANSSSSTKTAQINPLVQITVQAKSGKLVACAANQLAAQVVSAKYLGKYATQQAAILQQHVAFDNKDIKAIEAAIAGSAISTTDKLILQQTLRQDQLDLTTNSGLLLEVTNAEMPQVLTPAAAHRITARSRRNTVVVAAIIGLILGALAALFWDRAAALARS